MSEPEEAPLSEEEIFLKQMQARLPHWFKVLSHIGSGGGAHVLHANHLLERMSFAVKLARDPKIHEWILNERAVLRALKRHSGIVDLCDHDPNHGDPVNVLEYIPGKTFHELLHPQGVASKRRPILDALEILLQVVETVAWIHEQGFVHSDLKPENVLVTQFDHGRRRAKIIDFGIARHIDVSVESAVISGSVKYLSPEAFRPDERGGLILARDIYALGIMLFEICTGSLPFTGDSVIQIHAAHEHSPIPSLAEVTGFAWPVQMQYLLNRMLSKSVYQRPTASEVAQILRSCLEEMYSWGINPVLPGSSPTRATSTSTMRSTAAFANTQLASSP